MKPDKPGKLNHNTPVDLETRLKRILGQMEETLNKHEIEQEILDTVKRIEAKLDAIGGGGGTSDAETIALLESTFRPIINGLKELSAP
jgi:hypothetical protein